MACKHSASTRADLGDAVATSCLAFALPSLSPKAFAGGNVPGAPTGVKAVPGNSAATVSWTAPSNDGGSPITGYRVRALEGGVYEASATCTAPCGKLTLLNVTDGHLVNGTRYEFQVLATNANGNSPWSALSASIVVGAPTLPKNVSAIAGDSSATVYWTPSSKANGSPITNYRVFAEANGSVAAEDILEGTGSQLTLTDGS